MASQSGGDPDADTHSVPIKRRSLRPVQPSQAASPFDPEPAMADGDYDAALAVLRNSRNGLERSPSMVEKLDEEQIRDLLLFNLNAQLTGQGRWRRVVYRAAGRIKELSVAGGGT